jgi:hypothetical protein
MSASRPCHRHRYLDEQSFRNALKGGTDGMRFLKAAAGIIGKRLMYRDLIGEPATT